MTPTFTPQQLRELADGMEAAYPNAATDLRLYADDLSNALPKWHDIRHVPANVTVTDKDGDRWQWEAGTLRIATQIITEDGSFSPFADWNYPVTDTAEYAPFTELIGD